MLARDPLEFVVLVLLLGDMGDLCSCSPHVRVFRGRSSADWRAWTFPGVMGQRLGVGRVWPG